MFAGIRNLGKQKILILCSLSMLITGCAGLNKAGVYSYPQAFVRDGVRYETMEDVKKYIYNQKVANPFEVKKGHGRIFIMRESLLTGADGAPLFSINGEGSIILGNGTCFTWEQPVGPCCIRFAHGTYDLPLKGKGQIYKLKKNRMTQMDIDVEEGRFYYLEFSVVGYVLERLDEEVGRKMVESNFKPVTFPPS